MKTEAVQQTQHRNLVYRLAVGSIFFFYGLCFASWASRIPDIQQKLHLSDAELGLVLFILPIGSFLSLPFSGWLIPKIGSRPVVIIAGLLYGSLLVCIGFSNSITALVLALFAFGFCSNTLNIAVNTQAVGVEKLYPKPILASFHGLWSLAGFAGAAIGTLMTGWGITPQYHYLFIWVFALLSIAISYRYLLYDHIEPKKKSGPLFSMPDKSLLTLGLIAFCSLMCEGAMFDWSGVYFSKVVMADKAMVGLGYTAFMITMAGTRFLADWLKHLFGLRRVLQCSGLLSASGLLLAVCFPSLTMAVIGFLLVGMGVSSVVPLVYSAVGHSKTISPGVALAAVSSLGFLGFLVGPPLIGFISGLSNLRISFSLIALMGLCVTFFATKAKY